VSLASRLAPGETLQECATPTRQRDREEDKEGEDEGEGNETAAREEEEDEECITLFKDLSVASFGMQCMGDPVKRAAGCVPERCLVAHSLGEAASSGALARLQRLLSERRALLQTEFGGMSFETTSVRQRRPCRAQIRSKPPSIAQVRAHTCVGKRASRQLLQRSR